MHTSAHRCLPFSWQFLDNLVTGNQRGINASNGNPANSNQIKRSQIHALGCTLPTMAFCIFHLHSPVMIMPIIGLLKPKIVMLVVLVMVHAVNLVISNY